jgi:hypothetical protein
MKTIKQEIFSVGTWHGIDFTVNDLKTMAASFHSLKEQVKVPLKLGHNDKQPFAENGLPAFGWVSDMQVDTTSKPEKLVAVFDNIPDVLYNAMEQRLYRSVSIELDFGVKYKDAFYDLVVSAVAILGADAPAVHNLNDLAHYISPEYKQDDKKRKGAAYSKGKQVVFNFNSGNPEEKKSMMTEEEKKAYDKAIADAARLAAENAQHLQFKQQTEAEKAAAKKQAIVDKRTKVKALFEKAVTDKLITPAKRESFYKTLRVEDDGAVEALALDEVETLLKEEKDSKLFSAGAHNNGVTTVELKEHETVDGKLSSLVKETLAEKGWENSPANFSKAQTLVFAKHPELAKAYMGANGSMRTH